MGQSDGDCAQVLERMKAIYLTLNWQKCNIGLTELAFFGKLVSEKGICQKSV